MAITGVNTYQDYGFTGGVQTFTAPISGTYKLEVWGAQGGIADAATWDSEGRWKHIGGLGGYANGAITLQKNQTIYVTVGGTPTRVNDRIGGYNGGGHGSRVPCGGGGGATHIATANRGVLSNYSSYRSELFIIAGGGGGAGTLYAENIYGRGGAGGGWSGEDVNGKGGTQTAGGKNNFNEAFEFVNSGFGQGTSIIDLDPHGSAWTGQSGGGGGGYYGGGGGGYYGGGGGGSGFIGGVLNGSMKNGIQTGNGYARITLAKRASQLYYKDTLVETLSFNGSLVDTVIYNGTTVMG